MGFPLRVLLVLLLLAQAAAADIARPVAVRWWGRGVVSIETHWGLTAVIDPHGDPGAGVPRPAADLVLARGEPAEPSDAGNHRAGPVTVRWPSSGAGGAGVFHTLDRRPGEAAVRWRDARTREARTPHALRVTSVPATSDDAGGGERGGADLLLIEVDGVRIVYAGDRGQTPLSDAQRGAVRGVDVLLLPVGGAPGDGGSWAAAIIEEARPRYAVPIHYESGPSAQRGEEIESLLDAVGDRYGVDRPNGNTLAVSSADGDDETSPRVALLGREAWEPTGELAELFAKMEAACEASRRVFAELSAEQLNWRPPDGSHTPRWNAEHMMGRQLGFFSQIYAALDPEIGAIDLNPRQMPPDYQAAHPEWDGAEEARQMGRSAAFVRRFAYLLDGVDLDARAPGSRWTLRRLLLQMERHFNQHTANVKKKFELEGWPPE